MKTVRGGVLLLICVCLGCGHSTPAPSVSVATPTAPPDPETKLYQKLRAADYKIDGVVQDLSEAIKSSKKLAPLAGGEAKVVLSSIAALLNSSGEALADYDNVSDTLTDFKKDFAAEDDQRLKNIGFAVAALKKVREASDVVDDLGMNAPAQHKVALEGISNNIYEARTDLEEAIKSMGGQVPSEESDDKESSSGQ